MKNAPGAKARGVWVVSERTAKYVLTEAVQQGQLQERIRT